MGSETSLWVLDSQAVKFRDDVLLVVNKPPGIEVIEDVPGNSTDDELLYRVRQLWANDRVNLFPYTDLPREVSGLAVFVWRPRVHPELFEPISLGRIHSKFIAAVNMTPGLERYVARLADSSAEGMVGTRRGKRTSPARDRRGKRHEIVPQTQGISGFRVVWNDRARAMAIVEAWCDGPEALQAALRTMGVHVAGDDGSLLVAPRMMIHLQTLVFRHPLTTKRCKVTTPLPWEFEAWKNKSWHIDKLRPVLLREAIMQCASARLWCRRCDHPQGFRVVHGEGEGLGGLDVEWLSDYAVVWVADGVRDEVIERVIEAVQELKPRGIYLKRRPVQASRYSERDAERLVVPHAVRGQDAPERLTVREYDVDYLVQLDQGLSTGLFLDQRGSRGWMKHVARGKRVLNLFAYTCSFTVAAAVGGASSTVSVDVSRRSLQVGAENLALNGVEGPQHELVCDDVQKYLKSALRKVEKGGQKFDVIVFDPPSFGSTRRGTFVLIRDFVEYAAQCMRLIGDCGWLLACTNHRGVSEEKLRGWLYEAAELAQRCLTDCEPRGNGSDFPYMLGREPHLKAFLCRIANQRPSATVFGDGASSAKSCGKANKPGRLTPGGRNMSERRATRVKEQAVQTKYKSRRK